MKECYVGLGSNLGNSIALIREATSLIAAFSSVEGLKLSRLYRTSPVSDIPQEMYINAVCRFKTTETPYSLFKKTRAIERKLGRDLQEAKNAPRLIDIDILFYEKEMIIEDELMIPHPRVYERLFVLKPLSDLTDTLPLSHPEIGTTDLKRVLKSFINRHNEKVRIIEEKSCPV